MLQAQTIPTGQDDAPILSIRCPACSRSGAFHILNGTRDALWQQSDSSVNGRVSTHTYRVGIRICPVRKCQTVVFFSLRNNRIISTYPPETIDFDSSGLPTPIKDSLEEAIKCHAAGCYKASALMVRRTLEEVCEDKNLEGNTLKDRISALGGAALIPKELIDAADELRLLGNDAAHIEAKTYDSIGKNEIEIAIDLTKELLKGVYQYSSLVNRLRALKKPTS